MKKVVRLLTQPALWVCLLMIAAPISVIFSPDNPSPIEMSELKQEKMPLYVSSPGHSVFGEYVGAHWCGPCMDSASPSLTNLKTSNPEEFTFVSFFESEFGGWPSDSPILRTDHVMNNSDGYPTFSFGDQQSGSCYKVGSSGSHYYDTDFANGGCMSDDSSNFQLEMSMSLNATSEEVTIGLEVTYVGTETSVQTHVYAAITEEIGADSYDNGYRPHHNWRGWLLNENQDGFAELTLFKDMTADISWTAPLSLVRPSSGHSQWENFWPVIALMDGPYDSFNTVLAAVDPAMGPLIDVGITQFTVENREDTPGFTPGDILDLNLEVRNNGVENYIEGGEFGIYIISGSDVTYLGGQTISELGPGSTQSLDLEFDTSEITMANSGITTFRAMITDLSSDRNSSNNLLDALAFHDMPPSPARPAAVGSTSFERGDAVQFESTALSNDLVDDMSTMSPTLEYSPSGTSQWTGGWVISTELAGSGGNAVYLHTIQTPPTAGTGFYDIRTMWQDLSGQESEWLVTEEAFELHNALPKVLSSNDPGFVGYPTVKLGDSETISLSGLVRDAETPLSMLAINSSDPEFLGWNSATTSITVQFDEIARDSQGNPLPQGVFISIDDGEDVNNGMLLFNVIESGAPRWAPITTQPVFEAGSATISLTEFLSDTDDDGNPVSANGLVITIVSNSNEGLLQATVAGQTVTASTVDEDSTGVAEITVRASDGSKSSDTTIVFFVININDPPSIDLDSLSDVTLKANEPLSADLQSLLSDVDDPTDKIWLTATTPIPGAIQFDHISGYLSMQWEEPGTHVVSVMIVDRHGDWSTSEFTVTVLDTKPLSWDSEETPGDLRVSIDGPYVGSDAEVTLSNVGTLELNEVSTTWTICNSIVGVCHTAGSYDGLGTFVAAPASGNGMALGDYLTLFVRALDGDSWDRESDGNFKVDSIDSGPDVDESDIVDEEDQESQAEETGGSSEISPLTMVLYFLIVVVFIGGGTLGGLYLSRRQETPPGADRGSGHEGELLDFEGAEPEETHQEESTETHPPIPEEGIPAGWTLEQWQYYGEDYLKNR